MQPNERERVKEGGKGGGIDWAVGHFVGGT